MKESFKKTITVIASFMVFGLGVAENSLSMENTSEAFGKDVNLTSEIYFNTKFSENVTAKATIVNLLYSYNAESSMDFNDWSADNYTFKSPVSLNDFYVEYGKDNFSGGAGIKTFPEREGLLSALQDIEYQFFPVDATNPLRMKRIGVPGIWGKFFFNPDTYVKLVGYESHWSKISPEAVPVVKDMTLDNPTGDQGFSFFSSFGTKFDDTDVEIGYTRGWGSWPSKKNEPTYEFSPNPYKLSAAYVKVREHFNSWALGSTALVKNANENAGSVYNMVFSVDKKLSLWGKPVSLGASYFYVQSFEHSRHFRTSPWEDLGNSFGFRASVEDKDQQVRYGFESVVNHEEHGYYLMGITEKWMSNSVKLRTQMDFFYDEQKFISDEHDAIRIGGFVTFAF